MLFYLCMTISLVVGFLLHLRRKTILGYFIGLAIANGSAVEVLGHFGQLQNDLIPNEMLLLTALIANLIVCSIPYTVGFLLLLLASRLLGRLLEKRVASWAVRTLVVFGTGMAAFILLGLFAGALMEFGVQQTEMPVSNYRSDSMPHAEIQHWNSAPEFSPDGWFLALGAQTNDMEQKIVLLEGAASKTSIPLPVRAMTSTVIEFSPDGSSNLLVQGDSGITVWNFRTRKKVASLRLEGEVTSLAFSPDGKLLASSAYADNLASTTVVLWDTSLWRPAGEPLGGHTGPVNCLAFSPDGKTLVSCDKDHFRLWDVTTQQLIGQPLPSKGGDSASVWFSLDGQQMFSYPDENKSILAWNLGTQPATSKVVAKLGQPKAVTFNPHRMQFAWNSSPEDGITILDVTTGQRFRVDNTGAVDGLTFSPDGNWLVFTSGQRLVSLLGLP